MRRAAAVDGNRTVLAIDPGPTHSACVIWSGSRIIDFCRADNDTVLEEIIPSFDDLSGEDLHLVIEKIACYGMAVGAEVFETVFWSGRFAQAFGADRCDRIERLKVKLHLCKDSRAKDANIRQALIDRLGPPGTKKNPGPTYGISGDCWSALAVAVTWSDQQEKAVECG